MFEVTCPCGNAILVSAGQAGGTARCDCGQTVPVPLLSELRREARATGRLVKPRPMQHDWRMWWWGVGLVITGYAAQFVGFNVYLFAGTNQTVAGLAGVTFMAGYLMSLVGIFAVGLGKGFEMWFCFLLYFIVPFGGLIMLFFPGKGADETP